MTIDFELQELNFTLFTKQFNPAILNLNALQRAKVIKPSWELAEEPSSQSNSVKLAFNNQVRILAQSDRIVFAETVGNKRLQDINIAESIFNYAQGFPDIKCRAVSINPGGYAGFSSTSEACKYLSEGLLSPTAWRNFQGEPINAVGLKLAYPHKSGNFYLDVNQASLDIAGKRIAAVWYAGSFHYRLASKNWQQRYSNLNAILQNWQSDIENYQTYINNELLAVSVIPSVSIFPL